MFIKLENGIHINAKKIMSIEPKEQGYSIKMLSGPGISLSTEQFPWLAKICGFLIQLKSGSVINTFAIVAITFRDKTPVLILEDGSAFETTEAESLSLMGRCERIDLANRIQFLQSKNIPCEDYKRL